VVSAGRKVAGQKRQERDRRRAEIGRRRALMLAVAVVLVVAVGWGMVALWQAPLFTIDTVNVTGVSHLKREDVLKLAAIPPDATLVRLPKAQIVARIQSSPWVSGVEVTRSFPNTLDVAIAERVPTATVDAQAAGQWLVSGDGYWIAPRGKDPTGTLVPIRDVPNLRPAAGQKIGSPELTNALAVIAGLSPELKAKTKLVSAASVEKTMLVLKNDIQVFFGPAEEVAKKDLIARSILSREKNIVYINVRITDRPTWRGLNAAN
jgi:cell division protein FtsQ